MRTHTNKESAMQDVRYFEEAAQRADQKAQSYRAIADRLRKEWGEKAPVRE